MNFHQRIETARKLERRGKIFISNGRYKRRDIATVCGGLIHVESQFPIVHPFEGYKLDNPMTWDTFTHLYLLRKDWCG